MGVPAPPPMAPDQWETSVFLVEPDWQREREGSESQAGGERPPLIKTWRQTGQSPSIFFFSKLPVSCPQRCLLSGTAHEVSPGYQGRDRNPEQELQRLPGAWRVPAAATAPGLRGGERNSGTERAFSLPSPLLLWGQTASWEGFSQETRLSFPLGASVIKATPNPFKGPAAQ